MKLKNIVYEQSIKSATCSIFIQVKFTGLTGKVAFDPVTSERLVESGLDFMNINEDYIKKVT